MGCTLCPRRCGAERTVTHGYCGGGDRVRVARAAPHLWEEPCLSGERGAGAVFFSGCPLRCVYCQNASISAGNEGQELSCEQLADVLRRLERKGVHNLDLVTPLHYTGQVLKALALAAPRVPVVVNCGGYELVDTVRRWEGHADVWLPDLKYHSSALSARYSAAPDYFEHAAAAILEMHRQQPTLVWDGTLLRRGLIVRHLVLPGESRDSLRLLDWLAEALPRGSFLLSLMSQFTPTAACAAYPSLDRRVTTFEYRRVADRARELGFEGYAQGRRSAAQAYTPVFDLTGINPEDRQRRNTMYRKEIEAYFERSREQMLADIARLVNIKSVREEAQPGKPFGEGPYRALQEAMLIAKELGHEVRNFDNYVMTAEAGPQPVELGILAHLDVVPEGAGWTSDPYQMIERDGRIYGRGTSDDKGAAVVALYAAAAAREIAPALKRGVRVILGTAEETGSEDLAHYFKTETPPPYSFSPDAGYPVINIEKGNHSPFFSQSWPADKILPRVVSIHGGETKNIVTREASALTEGLDRTQVEALCRKHEEATGVRFTVRPEGAGLRIDALGVSAHAASPDTGKNAQTALLALLSELPLHDSPCARAIHALHELFPYGDNGGHAIGVAQSDELSGALTLVFSVLELTETGFEGRYDSRVPICANWDNMGSIAIAALRGKGFDVRREQMGAPHHTPADLPFVKTLLQVYEDYTGNKGECIAIGGGTYVHDIEGGVAFGCELPGTDNHIHGADEFAVIDELILSAKMFTQVILDLCC